MAGGAPILKVYSPYGRYVASCKHCIDAAVLAGFYGVGAQVRLGHKGVVLWYEGREHISANESFDGAASVMLERWQAAGAKEDTK